MADRRTKGYYGYYRLTQISSGLTRKSVKINLFNKLSVKIVFMAKQIVYGAEARQKLLEGIRQLVKAVATTLGPKGRNVAIDRKWGAPNVIHDGVTVAKEIYLKDPLQNMGAQLVKEAASKTADVAGD